MVRAGQRREGGRGRRRRSPKCRRPRKVETVGHCRRLQRRHQGLQLSAAGESLLQEGGGEVEGAGGEEKRGGERWGEPPGEEEEGGGEKIWD